MKILFLTQVLPFPLDAGPKVRAYYVLRYLAQRHDVTLLSFVRPEDTHVQLEQLSHLCKRVHTVPMRRSRLHDGLALGRSLLSGKPFLILRDQIPAMERYLEQTLAEDDFDAVHADQLWMASYAQHAGKLLRSRGKAPRLVLDQHNAVYLIPQRMAHESRRPLMKQVLQHESRALGRYEVDICQRYDRVVWVTEQDRQALQSLDPANGRLADERRNAVIPICVDASLLTPLQRMATPETAFFLGGMHWPPNAEGVEWFASQVLPLIQAQRPGLRFLAVGKNPPERIRNLPGVQAPGYVSDAEPWWQDAGVFVTPIHAAGGMRVKILDAWGRGLPVVSTSIGAEGLTYQDGENILIADTPQQFAAAVLKLLAEPDLYARISRAGRQTIEQRYHWQTTYRAFDAIYA